MPTQEQQIEDLELETPNYTVGLGPCRGRRGDCKFCRMAWITPSWNTGRVNRSIWQFMSAAIRPNWARVVPRRFLTVLSPGTPQPFQRGSGRLELAQAIVGEGSAALSAGDRESSLGLPFWPRTGRDRSDFGRKASGRRIRSCSTI